MAMARTAMPEAAIHKHCHTFAVPNKIGRTDDRRGTAPSRDSHRTEQTHEPLFGARVPGASDKAHNYRTSFCCENIGHVQHIMLERGPFESSIAAWPPDQL